MMKKQILLITLALLPMLASADAVEIGGIYYTLITKGNAAEVTENPNKYNGSLVIPEAVTYNATVYNVKSIGDGAFNGCSGLSSVTIPNSVTSIRDGAFYGCSGLTTITIPNSVTSIGVSAFEGCSVLTSVTIPSSVTSIGVCAFKGCSGLPSITIPNSVTSIGASAFCDCSKLTSITIPNRVTTISDHTFSNCSNLTSVTIPNSVTIIEDKAFWKCYGLTSVIIPNGVTYIGRFVFLDCPGLTSVTIPNSVTSIGEGAFGYCSGLTSVTIPNSVTGIWSQAFYGCLGLTTVSIGSSATYISTQAFAQCPELKEVYCLAETVPETSSDAFEGSPIENASLHVLNGAVNAYKAAEPWKNFGIIGGGEVQKCAMPTISYADNKLTFSSTTEGVEYVSEIRDADIKKRNETNIWLNATYRISVYATKSGYTNSDIATATLCWIDQQPRTEGITDGVANIPANAVLIQSQGGTITVQGCDEGEQVSVYGINDTQAGTSISQNGAAIVNTSLQPGSITIVKIGENSVKVVMK